MTEEPPDQPEETRSDPDDEYTGAPRWVKATGIILIVVVVLAIVLKLTGIAPDHGPSRHMDKEAPRQERSTDAADSAHEPSKWNHG